MLGADHLLSGVGGGGQGGKRQGDSAGWMLCRLLARGWKMPCFSARLHEEPGVSAGVLAGAGGRVVQERGPECWVPRCCTSRQKGFCKASPGTSQAPRRARKKAEGGASSNVFSMFDQSQIQEFKEVGQLPPGLWEVTGTNRKPLGVGSALSPWGVVTSPLEAARLQLSHAPPRSDELSSGSPAPLYS